MVKKSEKIKNAEAEKKEAKICTSCGSSISGAEPFSEFLCPDCAKVMITRCSKCKLTANSYKCGCGFEGP